jgi:hypothetical protein
MLYGFLGCTPNQSNRSQEYPVHYEILYTDVKAGAKVGYISDPDSLWKNTQWLNAIKSRLIEEAIGNYSTVILFDSKEHTPNISMTGFDNYSTTYDGYMVCGYWKYPNGNTQFLSFNIEENGN